MDFSLCQELLKQAEQWGAHDAAIVVENIIHRHDIRNHRLRYAQTEKIYRANLHLHFENAAFQIQINQGNAGIMPQDTILKYIQKGIQTAKIANTWGTAQPLKSLKTLFGQTSAQICPNIHAQQNNEQNTPTSNAEHNEKKQKSKKRTNTQICTPQQFEPECLLEHKLFETPMLDKLEKVFQEIPQFPQYYLKQTTSYIDQSVCFLNEDIKSQKRYETVIQQSIDIENDPQYPQLRLPHYWFDGIIHDPNTPEHKEMLMAADVWPSLSASLQSQIPADPNLYGLILSPWILGILAHEAHHLGANLTTSGKFKLDMAKCLYLPPRPRQHCAGLSIEHISNARPTQRLFFARVPSHTLIVDVPIAWTRRQQHFLDMKCMMACEMTNQTIGQYFKPVILRFDLLNMWSHCAEIAEPTRRIALQCGESIGATQAPWAYFNMKIAYRNAL